MRTMCRQNRLDRRTPEPGQVSPACSGLCPLGVQLGPKSRSDPILSCRWLCQHPQSRKHASQTCFLGEIISSRKALPTHSWDKTQKSLRSGQWAVSGGRGDWETPSQPGRRSSEPWALGVEGLPRGIAQRLQRQVLPSPGLAGSTQPCVPPSGCEPLAVVLVLGHCLRSAAPWGRLGPHPDCESAH